MIKYDDTPLGLQIEITIPFKEEWLKKASAEQLKHLIEHIITQIIINVVDEILGEENDR